MGTRAYGDHQELVRVLLSPRLHIGLLFYRVKLESNLASVITGFEHSFLHIRLTEELNRRKDPQ